MSILENARKLRPIIEQAVESLDDNTALKAIQLHPDWATGIAYAQGYKVRSGGKLWRAVQAHTSQTGWEPENAASLWERVNETHAGTTEDPIPYEGNMELTAGLYYLQDGVVYLCTRDSGIAVHNTLAELVGLYVEVA